MPFQKGNKLSRGGTKGNKGGPPTKEQSDFKQKLKDAVDREAKRRVEMIAKRYLDMADDDPATMRHLIDKAIAPAKQEIALQHIGCYRIDAFDPNNPDKKRRGT